MASRTFADDLIAARRAHLAVWKLLKSKDKPAAPRRAAEPPAIKAERELQFLLGQIRNASKHRLADARLDNELRFGVIVAMPVGIVKTLNTYKAVAAHIAALCPQFCLTLEDQGASCRVAVTHPGITRAEYRNPQTQLSPFKAEWFNAIYKVRMSRLQEHLRLRKQMAAYSTRLQKLADNLAYKLEQTYVVDGRDTMLEFVEFVTAPTRQRIERQPGFKALVAAAKALSPDVRVWVKEPDLSRCKWNVAVHVPGLPPIF